MAWKAHTTAYTAFMVRLSRIYTKTGDDGTTGLGDGARVSKTDIRVEAYGQVDEANAFIGSAVAECSPDSPPGSAERAIREILVGVQNDLFDVGADLCTPIAPGEKTGGRLRVSAAQTKRLEEVIDRHNEGLEALKSFVLPGGSRLAVTLHIARTVVRRAERATVALAQAQAKETNREAVLYLNRLSDLLFVLGRVANVRAGGDVLWVPGGGRGEAKR
jgi:cob(I)alamin adenosyltransferase